MKNMYLPPPPKKKPQTKQQHHLATQSVYNRGQLSHIYCDVSSLSLLPVQNNFILLTLLKAQHLVEVKNVTPHILHSAKLSNSKEEPNTKHKDVVMSVRSWD